MCPQDREQSKSLAERQMRVWARTSELTEQLAGLEGHVPRDSKLGPVLTISREHGAGGSQIAELAGEMLGWEVYDRCLLDRVAQRYHLPRPMLELVDETKSNWVHDVLGTWLDSRVVPHEKYIAHLRQVILSAVHGGRAIIVGRGAQFLLPRESILAVRIIASEAYRVARVVAEQGLTERAACRTVREIDHGRAEFVSRFFHRDINDPHIYDLTINVEHYGPVAAAEAIVKICADL